MKNFNYLIIFIVIFFMSLLFINPQVYSISVINGFNLFFNNVLVTAFPFMFFTSILQNTNLSNIIAKMLYKPINKIYHTGSLSCYIFVISLICGCPVTSKLLSMYYTNNKLSSAEVLAISSFTSNYNPIFIIGTIGSILLKNENFALIILISHYTSSLINGIIYSSLKINKQKFLQNDIINNTSNLYDNMLSVMQTLLVICGFIVIFNFICDCLINTNIIYYFSKPLSYIYSKLQIPTSLAYYNLLSFIEATRGIKEIASTNLPPIYILPSISSCLSFGGMSQNFQCYSFLQSANIKFYSFIKTKITQAIFAYVICFLLCLMLKI